MLSIKIEEIHFICCAAVVSALGLKSLFRFLMLMDGMISIL
jgi:hypothetical protein